MKKMLANLKSNLLYLLLSAVLMGPVFTSLTACGDDIAGPRVEDDEQAQESKTGDEND